MHTRDVTNAAHPTAREINDTIRYTCWAVYARTGADVADDAAAGLAGLVDAWEAEDVVVRGWYDVSVTCDAEAGFLRRFAGRLENGKPGAQLAKGDL